MAKPIEIDDPRSLKAHPAATLFPLMEGEAFETLTLDIKKNGLRSAIVLHEGAVLDGRNRLAACLAAGVTPRFVAWSTKGSLTRWVFSMNYERRHLNDAQRAMIAARAKGQYTEEAHKRKVSLARTRKNKGKGGELGANWRQGRAPKAAAKVAETLKVSPRMVERATQVLRDGDDELVAAVDRGEVAVSAAAEVSKLPKAEQREHVQKGTIAEVAQQLRDGGAPVPPINKYAMAERLRSKKRDRSTDVSAFSEVLYTVRSVHNAWRFLVSKWDAEQCADERHDMLAITKASRERKLIERLAEVTADFEELANLVGGPSEVSKRAKTDIAGKFAKSAPEQEAQSVEMSH